MCYLMLLLIKFNLLSSYKNVIIYGVYYTESCQDNWKNNWLKPIYYLGIQISEKTYMKIVI